MNVNNRLKTNRGCQQKAPFEVGATLGRGQHAGWPCAKMNDLPHSQPASSAWHPRNPRKKVVAIPRQRLQSRLARGEPQAHGPY
eukprot:3571566-Prymnesium_polylepis.3